MESTIQFFNTLSGKLEEFKPLDPAGKEVRMYTCGPTVYDYAHIGNFRAFVFEDLLRRFLEFKGFQVKHVMNITDVDDKTIAGAKRAGKKLEDFTRTYTEAFQEDLKRLNILPANYPAESPRATREIPSMIELIEKLVKKGSAYVSDGSVYYRVSSFSGYGRLSKKNLQQNIKGARVDVDEYDKEEGADFVLWKRAKEGEPSWDSPWGKGRPGWHVECSAMSMKYLGETFDIHAGGEDLIFPHHENEIAQSEAATGKKFVDYWLHCKHLLVNGEKMSKSKGNFYALRDLLKKGYDPMAIRYALLSVHYRQPLNFTLEGLKEAGEVIKRMDDCYFQCFSHRLDIFRDKVPSGAFQIRLNETLEKIVKAIELVLGNDLNISEALALFFDGIKEINRAVAKDAASPKNMTSALEFFMKLDPLFGFDISLQGETFSSEELRLFDKRNQIRNQPGFRGNPDLQRESDELRSQIKKLGWLVNDGQPEEPSTVKKRRRAWD